MKKLILITLFFISSFFIKAQDILFLKTGAELNVKILTITNSEVSYKYSSGETFTIPKTKIFKIRYENGTEELFVKKKRIKETISNDKKALFYLSSSFSYSYQMLNSWVGNSIYKTTIDTTNNKQTLGIYGTLGEGINWNIGFGLLFKNKIGFELTYNNFSGNNLVFVNSNTMQNTNLNNQINEKTETKNKLDYIALCGSLLFKHHWFYGKIGLIMANPSIYIDSVFSRKTNGLPILKDSIRLSNSELSAPLQMGFIGGIGIQIPLGKHIGLFTESNFMMLNVQPNKLHYIKIIDNDNEKQKPDDLNLVETTDGKTPNEIIGKTFSANSWNWALGLKILF